jgi:hypothetical protein
VAESTATSAKATLSIAAPANKAATSRDGESRTTAMMITTQPTRSAEEGQFDCGVDVRAVQRGTAAEHHVEEVEPGPDCNAASEQQARETKKHEYPLLERAAASAENWRFGSRVAERLVDPRPLQWYREFELREGMRVGPQPKLPSGLRRSGAPGRIIAVR